VGHILRGAGLGCF